MPPLAIDMIGIGERSGSLREMLDEVAIFYDAESEVRLEQLTTTLEPAILVVMGGVVVTILLAIYLPIIQSISGGRTALQASLTRRASHMKQIPTKTTPFSPNESASEPARFRRASNRPKMREAKSWPVAIVCLS